MFRYEQVIRESTNLIKSENCIIDHCLTLFSEEIIGNEIHNMSRRTVIYICYRKMTPIHVLYILEWMNLWSVYFTNYLITMNDPWNKGNV